MKFTKLITDPKTRHKKYLIAMILLILWAVVVYLMNADYEKKKVEYLESELESFEAKLNSTLRSYEWFADYVEKTLINRPEVLTLVADAVNADLEKKTILRESLKGLIQEDYGLLKTYHFRQLHFHLPDGESFLRMHSPEKFGDLLFDVRESVRLANTEKRTIVGFEEGRIFNGYRFVFPLFFEQRHVGSVEVSVSMASALTVIRSLVPGIQATFVIDQSVVEETVWDSMQDHYQESPVLDGYLMDLGIGEAIQNPESDHLEPYKSVIAHAIDIESRALANKESFATLVTEGGEEYVIRFLAIENIDRRPVAYLIGISKNNIAKGLYTSLARDLALVTGFFLLIMITIWTRLSKLEILEYASNRDPLTGLYNRRKFSEEIQKIRRRQTCSSFAVILLDIDHFKHVNDTYGHAVGDEVLQHIARILLGQIRNGDLVARWGGEEFLLFLPGTTLEIGQQVAERLRVTVASHPVPFVGSVTASFGVTTVQTNGDFEQALHQADLALYRAKENGRNCVET